MGRVELVDLDRAFWKPGQDFQLAAAVREAYGMKPKEDPLAFLLSLNLALAKKEEAGEPVTAPRPAAVRDGCGGVCDGGLHSDA